MDSRGSSVFDRTSSEDSTTSRQQQDVPCNSVIKEMSTHNNDSLEHNFFNSMRKNPEFCEEALHAEDKESTSRNTYVNSTCFR